MAVKNEKTTMNLPQQPVHNFTWKAKNFADKESFEKSLRFDDDGNLCSDKNSLRFAAIRPGMYVAACQANPEIAPRYNFDMEAVPVIGFSFHLSGKLECTRQLGAGKRLESTVHQRGDASIFYLHRAKGYSQHLSREMLNSVIVYMDYPQFAELIAEEVGEMPKDCCNLLRQDSLVLSLPMTSEMYNVAARAFHHPYHGTASRLHLESCGLELLALQIDQLSRHSMHCEKPLCRADEERIRMAGDILLRQMASPPTISALAAEVGVNSAKLKRGFKQIFGATIGQFLLQHRMSYARELILERQVDVTQAAFTVGYSNVSHFIRYYKRVFGVTPGCHKQAGGSRILPPDIKE